MFYINQFFMEEIHNVPNNNFIHLLNITSGELITHNE